MNIISYIHVKHIRRSNTYNMLLRHAWHLDCGQTDALTTHQYCSFVYILYNIHIRDLPVTTSHGVDKIIMILLSGKK